MWYARVMRYRFAPFELDADRFELRKGDVVVPTEPQVLSLLLFLAANRDRLVTRDEIVDAVWQGRIVSEAAISSRIKSARRAVGDDGTDQRVVRTVHGRGFRFVAQVDEVADFAPEERPAVDAPERPSIAVLPLAMIGGIGRHAIVAEALPHEVITELCRLRWLFVVARGSSFRFAAPTPDVRLVGAALGVRYCLSGTLEDSEGWIIISVELADTRDRGVVWAERYSVPIDAVHEVRSSIAASVVAALDLQIPLHEAACARLAAPDSLDSWSTYHLGLQRMFRFTAQDNAAAGDLFARAAGLEPGFARAYAGLSFTRFQDAFLDYADATVATAAAREAAERGVALDPLDPFVNAAMGRAHWLSGELEAGLAWLDRSTSLSPNYAQGIYSRAWTETLLCRGEEGQRHADRAMALSPVDPLRYAMLATRALSHLVRGEDADAACWADRAAREPGAHALIAVIAAACQATVCDDAKARSWIEIARKAHPGLSCDRFFRSFPFADGAVRSRIATALDRAGL